MRYPLSARSNADRHRTHHITSTIHHHPVVVNFKHHFHPTHLNKQPTKHIHNETPSTMLLNALSRTILRPSNLTLTQQTRSCSICAARSLLPSYGKTIIPCPSPISTSPSFSGFGGSIARPRVGAVVTGADGDKGVRGMKVRSSVKKFCDGCSVVRRKGYLYVVCSKDPKHKQVSRPGSFWSVLCLFCVCV